jgi:hypothetical protein
MPHILARHSRKQTLSQTSLFHSCRRHDRGVLGAREKRIWLAGVESNRVSYGQGDVPAVNTVQDAVHVHDLQATLIHLPGVDHEKLTCHFQGRQFRPTDVHGQVLRGILSSSTESATLLTPLPPDFAFQTAVHRRAILPPHTSHLFSDVLRPILKLSAVTRASKNARVE